jgi:predicted RNase H-like HicB family nuclease
VRGGVEVSTSLRYLVVIEHMDGTGYSAWVPDLPGCVAAAGTQADCERLIREAIMVHLAGLREDGDAIPEPVAIGAMIEVEAA